MQVIQNKSNTRKWKAVLESNLGRPLRNRGEASAIAVLLENQNLVNRGAKFESANITADVAQYQQQVCKQGQPDYCWFCQPGSDVGKFCGHRSGARS